jgi:hypothetical protein
MDTVLFLQGQGFEVNQSEIAQDNNSAILLENYGKAVGGRKSRHITIKYYFVTDRVAAKELKITKCDTDDMIADYFTKPLQGSKFKKFRDLILNVAAECTTDTSTTKECVETNGTINEITAITTAVRRERKKLSWHNPEVTGVVEVPGRTRKQRRYTGKYPTQQYKYSARRTRMRGNALLD